jgi:hypothetical protein
VGNIQNEYLLGFCHESGTSVSMEYFLFSVSCEQNRIPVLKELTLNWEETVYTPANK